MCLLVYLAVSSVYKLHVRYCRFLKVITAVTNIWIWIFLLESNLLASSYFPERLWKSFAISSKLQTKYLENDQEWVNDILKYFWKFLNWLCLAMLLKVILDVFSFIFGKVQKSYFQPSLTFIAIFSTLICEPRNIFSWCCGGVCGAVHKYWWLLRWEGNFCLVIIIIIIITKQTLNYLWMLLSSEIKATGPVTLGFSSLFLLLLLDGCYFRGALLFGGKNMYHIWVVPSY